MSANLHDTLGELDLSLDDVYCIAPPGWDWGLRTCDNITCNAPLCDQYCNRLECNANPGSQQYYEEWNVEAG